MSNAVDFDKTVLKVTPKTCHLGQAARAAEQISLRKLETTLNATFDMYYRCDIAVLEKVARLKA